MKLMTRRAGKLNSSLAQILYLAHLLFAMTLCAAPPAAAQQNASGIAAKALPSAQKERQHVLLLTAYQFGLPVPDSIHRGILAAFREGHASIGDIFVEHLDLSRHNDAEHRAKLAAVLRHKLAGKRIGIVIAEGAPTTDFLVNEAKGLFPDAALLTLVTPNISALAGDPRKVIDIPWRVDPAGTLSAALKLFPDTRRVVVVTGARDGILPFLEEAKLALAPWQGKLDIEFTHQMSYEQMLQRISTLAANSLVIYSPYFSDSTGRSFIPAEVAVTVGQTATAPVFGTMEAYLGRGIGGGSLLKTEAVGQQAGKIALDYLSGRLALVKPVTTIITPTQMMFDQNELKRWKADSARLPEGSMVINQTPTLWGQYKLAVIAALLLFITLSALTATLLMLNRRLKKAGIETRDSREQFKILMDRAPEAILVSSVNPLRIVTANPKAEQLFGCSEEQLIQKGLEHFYFPEQPDGRSVSESLTANAERALRGEEVMLERNIRGEDGRSLVCEVRVVRLPHHDEWLLRSSFVDISERKQGEAEIARLNADLEQRVAARTADLETSNQLLTQAKIQADAASVAKSAFLANMSHEIRTPMNGIVGMANIMRREGVTPRQEKRLDTIDASAQHLLSVINDVLDLSKIEAGKFALEEAPVVVSSLMTNVSSILCERAKDKGIRLLIETGHLPHNLVGDPTRLQQALLNYATNAVKFTDKGAVTLRTLKQEETADSLMVRFEVQDTGIGIEGEALSRLFSAFEQADNSMNRKYGGTGLGLAITRRLAELMGGEVGADSTPQVGSTFWFTVKLKKSGKAHAATTESKVDAEAEIRRRYYGHHILVVDDEPVNRDVALLQLMAVDLAVDTAEDGAVAISLAQKNNYAVILMDMQMPRVNGLEATRQIRAMPGYSKTPIIAMTANAFAEDKAQCIEAGMNDFLIKPFNPNELFAILLRALSQGNV